MNSIKKEEKVDDVDKQKWLTAKFSTLLDEQKSLKQTFNLKKEKLEFHKAELQSQVDPCYNLEFKSDP